MVAAAAASFAIIVVASCDHGARNVLPSGAAGQQGAGQAGNTGNPGVAGDSGAAGSTGVAGDSGVAGSTGDAGSGGAGQAGTGGSGGGSAGSGGGGPAGSGGGGPAGSGGDTGAGGSVPAGNLVTNGDFSAGEVSWHVENDTGHSIDNGRYCVRNPGTSTLIGWSTSGANVMLNGGTQYRMSYQASASSGNVTMHVKVGLAVQPYTSDYETNETLNNSLQTFNHMFMPMNGTDQNMGIAFTFTGASNSTVCLDNVSIVPN
jgi:hypothetical protein